jgi:D-alanyl-lipoteichoic acid acyltransferase DltB (MBOAT superfamily)
VVGVSFIIFQFLSYLIEVRKKTYLPRESASSFLSFSFFFPHLAAGPICRPNNLLVQFNAGKPSATKEQVQDGMQLIAWALFKKLVLADALAPKIDQVFKSPEQILSVWHLFFVAIGYGWQIYFDFSAYTDGARGVAKLFGIELPVNFNFPYFARDLKDFWHRWHISLSTWFRDYVYLPLGGRAGVFPLLTVFILSALWHGIGTMFIFWGLWHGFWLLILRKIELPKVIAKLIMLFVVFFGWLIFRSPSWTIFAKFFHIFDRPSVTVDIAFYYDWILLIGCCILVEVLSFWGIKKWHKKRGIFLDVIWCALIAAALLLGSPLQEFIYFRF